MGLILSLENQGVHSDFDGGGGGAYRSEASVRENTAILFLLRQNIANDRFEAASRTVSVYMVVVGRHDAN